MYIYLKTPLQSHSKYLPHLVEHCSGHSALDAVDFFEFSYGLDGVSTPEYTRFEYDKRVPYEKALEKLFTSLQKSAFLYETQILQEELGDPSYDQRIYEAVVRQYINPAISLNGIEKPSREEVEKYHAMRYKPENVIVASEKFQVFYHGFKPQNTFDQVQLQIISDTFDFEDDAYFLLLYKNHSAKEYWELYFIFWMLCFCSTFVMRRQEGNYYFLEPYFHRFGEVCWCLFPRLDYQILTPQFFEHGKQYIFKMIAEGYFKEMFFLNEYFYGIPLTRIQVLDFYKNYTYTTFLAKLKAFL